MFSRVVLVAIMACLTASADAQPEKAQPQPKATPAAVRTPIMLASVTDTESPAATAAVRGETVRRPAPRVTTCRCGDPQPDPDRQPDE